MFGKTKDGSSEGDRAVTPIQQSPRPAAASSSAHNASSDESTISAGMTIVGKITGEGTVNVFGRVEGELRASTVMIAKGAEVEGDIVADDLSVGGRVKGTIHANRVKLNGSASVEGDIFHRSLSIEENARFEGSSRRDEAALETPRIPLGRTPQAQTPARAVDSGSKPNGAPDSAAHASPAA
jgi:cytoskeletal protein CcmA (bactofilin family)